MNKFSKTETKSIIIIFLILFFVTGINILASLRRGRDSIRKNDISAIENSLDTYLQKYKIYPLSSDDGKIIGCFESGAVIDEISGNPVNAIVCDWGKSKFEGENFMPQDPSFKKGASYYYVSNGRKYKFYISLEGKNEAEYTPSIVLMNLHCGTKICNYGKGN
ncbi:MAG: hypothetical protein ACD_19C00176G0062 [uncultured bacterium]|nr:MAG: hypothetical protein ACD_19C00176G0062 [uncultured bacterium]